MPPTLRYSPSLFYSRDEKLYPALVGALAGPDRIVSAVQRIWVTSTLENINGIGPANNKAPLPSPKKTLGVMGDGAVRLAPADRTLGIAEGIETGLSAQQYWNIPVWVSCGAWRMDRIWLPEGVERIIVFGDNGEEGHKAAHKASLAYHARGLECEIEFPPDEFNDWNDVHHRKQEEYPMSDAGYPYNKNNVHRLRDKPPLLRQFDTIDPSIWDDQEPEPIRWLVNGCIPRRSVTILSGDSGLGKSLLMQQLQTSCAIGVPWVGNRVEQVRSLGFYCEIPRKSCNGGNVIS